MRAAGVGLAGAAAVLLVALGRRPVPRRPLPPARSRGSRPDRAARAGTALARWLGSPVDPRAARRLVPSLLAAAAVAPPAPPLAVALLAAAWVRPLLRRRRERHDRDRAVLRGLPDAVDLLHLCALAGTGLALAHPAVAAKVPGPVGQALREADDLARCGATRADALVAALSPLGERAGALAHVLADHLRYGTALAPELDRLGLELRLLRRRRAEEDARRVPVRLLAPLVTCTLPAFAVLTVVPLLLASLQHLPT